MIFPLKKKLKKVETPLPEPLPAKAEILDPKGYVTREELHREIGFIADLIDRAFRDAAAHGERTHRAVRGRRDS